MSRTSTFEHLAHALNMAVREQFGCGASPTAAVLDAPAVRSGGMGVADTRGYDLARCAVGRKRYALTDTDGHLLCAAVFSVNCTTAMAASLSCGPHAGSGRFWRASRNGLQMLKLRILRAFSA